MRIFVVVLAILSLAAVAAAQSLQDQLSEACKKGDRARFVDLVREGAHPLEPDSKGKNPLAYLHGKKLQGEWAYLSGKIAVEASEEQLSKSAPEPRKAPSVDPKVQALCDAAEQGDLSSVKDSIAKDVDLNAKGNRGYTALMEASFNGHIPVVEALLKHKADTEVVDNQGSRTVLLICVAARGSDPEAEARRLRVVEVLLKNGARTNARYQIGITPLIHAARDGNVPLVRMLLRYGADKTAKAPNGRTALDYAKRKKHKEVMKLLQGKAASSSDPYPIPFRLVADAVVWESIPVHREVWTKVMGAGSANAANLAGVLVPYCVSQGMAKRLPKGTAVAVTGRATGILSEVAIPRNRHGWWIPNQELKAAGVPVPPTDVSLLHSAEN